MPRQRSPNRDRAYEIYQEHNGNITNRAIAEMLNIPEKTIGGWKCKDKWEEQLNGILQTELRSTPKQHGGQPGNKNAIGHKPSVPKGNVNAVKHGAYQTIYTAYLPEEERELYEQMPSNSDLDAEIKLLRMKIARLANRETDFFYDMFGTKHDKEISEEDRERGILACTKQLEKLIRTQENIRLQREKLELEKARQEGGTNESEVAGMLRGIFDDINGKTESSS